jgi:hypothetical protein
VTERAKTILAAVLLLFALSWLSYSLFFSKRARPDSPVAGGWQGGVAREEPVGGVEALPDAGYGYGGVVEPAVETVPPLPPPLALEPPEVTDTLSVEEYKARAEEYEREQELKRQQELEEASKTDLWVPLPERPGAEEEETEGDETQVE